MCIEFINNGAKMVIVRKRKIGNTEFYYLEHSIKKNKKVEKKEKYLGKKIPKNITELKAEFLNKIYQTKWYAKLDEIKRNFRNEMQKMPKEIREKHLEHFMIKFTYNTNRIEGGSLTYKDTSKLLHDKITPANKPTGDIKEAEHHGKVFYLMLDHKKDIDLNVVLKWHYLLFNETKPGIAGKIRNYQVAISGTKIELPVPAELNALLNDFIKWYNKNKNKIHPVELAALTHLKFVSIHPFGDGNGRISRLLMNFVLKKHRFPMLDITYDNRSSYYNALERSQLKKQEHIFVQYMFKRYIKDFKKFVKKNS
ncbi:MAG: Fic family protein [Candidatus Aenigmatarchaeota archaeon]